MPRTNFAAWLTEPTSGVAVVGASGWIGRAAVATVLAAAPGLPAERLRLFTGRPCEIALSGRILRTSALGPETRLGDGQWIVVHAGIIGGDASAGGEVRRRNDALLDQVLEMSGAADLRRLIFISSGAAGLGPDTPPAKAAYAAMKQDHERAVAAWSRETGRPSLVPRVFNIGGPYMTVPKNYALGDLILSLTQTGRAAIGAPDPVFRSYVHVAEMADTLFEMAVDGHEDGAPFDIGGAEIVEVGALARRIAGRLHIRDAVIDRPPATGGAGDWYVGDGRRYQAALFRMGREPASLDAIIDDTLAGLRPSQAWSGAGRRRSRLDPSIA
jgi:nucleoside-diphosphate-sugar epimerase